jgi:HlyD family secretion protein
MSATVDIQTETRNNVISVPISSVTTRIKKEGGGTKEVADEETKTATTNDQTEEDAEENVVEREEKQEVVFVYRDGLVRKVEVKTGIQDNNVIEILEGLKEGDEVVIAPYNAINKSMKDSMQVKKVTEEELFKVKK